MLVKKGSDPINVTPSKLTTHGQLKSIIFIYYYLYCVL